MSVCSPPAAPPTTGDQAGDVLLQAFGIVKRFGPTQALAGASLCLRAGQIHALLGENGAGKSTLIKTLVGAISPDAGELRLGDAPLVLDGVSDAVRRGIVPVYQQLTLFPHLTVLENLFAFELASGAGWHRARVADGRERAVPALEQVGLECDPATPVAQLSLAQRQLVEIARGIVRDCRVLILDEPTAALSRVEVDHLFAVMRRLAAAGRCVLFISHRLEEVTEVCDTVTVLRNGRTALDAQPLAGLVHDDLVSAMAGEAVESADVVRNVPGDPLLHAESVGSGPAFRDVDLTLRSGEILGVVGLIGSGAIELGEALAGSRPLTAGRFVLDGRALRAGSRSAALRAGVGLIPADRDVDGTFLRHSVLANAGVSSLPEIALRGLLSRRAERRRLAPLLERVGVHPADPDLAIGALSGGNQQKVIVARNLALDGAKVIVALEPTRGVDVRARREIHEVLAAAAEQGTAVLLASTDLDEVAHLSHRVIVMQRGRVVAELAAGSDPAQMLALLTGAHA